MNEYQHQPTPAAATAIRYAKLHYQCGRYAAQRWATKQGVNHRLAYLALRLETESRLNAKRIPAFLVKQAS